MTHKVVESRIHTNKSREYLWNKMNTPEKLIEIEEFGLKTTVKKISDNNFELKSKEYHVLATFIPNKGVNQLYLFKDYSLLTWFEIKGEKNCTIAHGEYMPALNNTPEELQEKERWLKEHFLEELKYIAK